MKKFKYLAAKDSFIRFTSESLDENKPENIKNWIKARLIDKNPEADYETKVGFFDAEKEMLVFYLEKRNIHKIKQLLEAFNSFTNEGLNRIEFKMLANLFNEKKDILTAHPEDHLSLREILSNTFHKLTEKSAEELTEAYNQTLSLLIGQDNDSNSS